MFAFFVASISDRPPPPPFPFWPILRPTRLSRHPSFPTVVTRADEHHGTGIDRAIDFLEQRMSGRRPPAAMHNVSKSMEEFGSEDIPEPVLRITPPQTTRLMNINLTPKKQIRAGRSGRDSEGRSIRSGPKLSFSYAASSGNGLLSETREDRGSFGCIRTLLGGVDDASRDVAFNDKQPSVIYGSGKPEVLFKLCSKSTDTNKYEIDVKLHEEDMSRRFSTSFAELQLSHNATYKVISEKKEPMEATAVVSVDVVTGSKKRAREVEPPTCTSSSGCVPSSMFGCGRREKAVF